MWPGQGQRPPNVYPSHPTMWPEEFGEGVPCDDVLTKSTLSRQSCAHLVPPLLSPPQLPTSPPPALPCTLLPLLSRGQLLVWSYCSRTFGDASLWSSLTATMVHSSSSSICRFLLLVLLGLMVAFVHTGKPPVQCDWCFYVCSVVGWQVCNLACVCRN